MYKALLCVLVSCTSLSAAQYTLSTDFPSMTSIKSWKGQWEEKAGYPKVPVHYIQWLIPRGEKIKSLQITGERGGDGPTPLALPQTPRYLPMCNVRVKTTQPHVFSPGEFYPPSHLGREQLLVKHGYSILSVPLYPVLYLPTEKKVVGTEKMSLTIETEQDTVDKVFSSPLPSDVEEVSRMISNPEMLSSFPRAKAGAAKMTYLIVGSEAYVKDLATWQLMENKVSRGITVGTHSLEKIELNFPGKDLQEKVRNAVKKHYEEDGTRFVLLVGNGYTLLPTRNYYLEGEEIGSDLYFGCFDAGIDLACEVAVGRAPVSTVDEYRTFVKKTLDAKLVNASHPQAKNTLLFGEQMDAYTFASSALEKLVTGGTAGDIATTGFPEHLNISRLKETASQHFSAEQVIEKINTGNFYSITHMGHCLSDYCMRFDISSIPDLKNSNGYFGITQGCHPGDLHGPNWAEQLIVHPSGGPFAQIANSSFGWFLPGGTDFPSNRQTQVLYDSIFREGIKEIGKANMRSKERLAPQAATNIWVKKVLVETNLFGDPEFHLAY